MHDQKQGQQQGNPSQRDERAGGRDASGSPASQPADIQGEGNYDAAREYNTAQRQFVQSSDVDAAARAAEPASEAEKAELRDAELKGKERAKR